MKAPKISVVTGYYKRTDVVERTLQSLLDQTEGDFELIVFDDASPDGTAQAIKSFIEKVKDERIVPIYHEENMGFTRGIINAVAKARGKYIAVQGSGDVSLPDRLKLQSKLLDENPDIGVVGSYYENIIEDRGIRRLRTPNADNATPESVSKDSTFTHGEVMFRKDIYDQAGGYRPQFEFCQDHDLWLRMIKLCRFATVKELLYSRFVNFEGVSYNPDKFLAQTQYGILSRKLALMPEAEQVEILKTVTRETLSDSVPVSDAGVQKKVVRAVLRAIVWRNNELAAELTRRFVVFAPLRMILRVIIFIAENLPGVHRLMAWVTGSSAAKEGSKNAA